jgi:hypothetical protein
MKFFILALSILGSYNSVYSDSTSSKTELNNQNQSLDDFLKLKWTGNENELFCNFLLNDDLEFGSKMAYSKEIDGWSCTLSFNPKSGKKIDFNGDQLVKISTKVDVHNGPCNKKVYYSIATTIETQELGWFTKKTKGSNTLDKGFVDTPVVSLDAQPRYMIIEKQNARCIAFTSAFPYSQM